MAARITKVKAQKVLAQVREAYGLEPGEEGPVLMEDWAAWSSSAPFAIVWEGGPYEWAIVVKEGEPSEEDWALAAEFGAKPGKRKPLVIPPGVFAEPMTSYALGLYQD